MVLYSLFKSETHIPILMPHCWSPIEKIYNCLLLGRLNNEMATLLIKKSLCEQKFINSNNN
jgi:hypothetical protein